MHLTLDRGFSNSFSDWSRMFGRQDKEMIKFFCTELHQSLDRYAICTILDNHNPYEPQVQSMMDFLLQNQIICINESLVNSMAGKINAYGWLSCLLNRPRGLETLLTATSSDEIYSLKILHFLKEIDQLQQLPKERLHKICFESSGFRNIEY
jgi:hypothetical protein